LHQLATIEIRPDRKWNTETGVMPIEIEGAEYFTAADIQRELAIVRQTLWRWRRAGVVPQGLRYRNKTIVFTRAEMEAIRAHSNRLEPAGSSKHRRRAAPRARRSRGDA